jgi:hypothetical protein
VIPVDAGICNATVAFPSATASDNCNVDWLNQTAGPANLTVLAPSNNTVTYIAVDPSGNQASCSFIAAVADQQPPTIVCPGDISVNVDDNLCTAVVNYSLPTVADNCGPPVLARVQGLAPLDAFPRGVTVVTWTATDASSLITNCSFTVTVTDNITPNISRRACVWVGGGGGVIATFSATFLLCCLLVSLGACALSLLSLSLPPSCSPPVFSLPRSWPRPACPASRNVSTASGVCYATVSYGSAAVSENCPYNVSLINSGIGTGQNFSLGLHTETLQVMDQQGNTATCSFTVNVLDDQAPSISKPFLAVLALLFSSLFFCVYLCLSPCLFLCLSVSRHFGRLDVVLPSWSTRNHLILRSMPREYCAEHDREPMLCRGHVRIRGCERQLPSVLCQSPLSPGQRHRLSPGNLHCCLPSCGRGRQPGQLQLHGAGPRPRASNNL